MFSRKRIKVPLLIILSLIFGTGIFLLGSKYTLDHLSITQVTPTQAANAMKADHFWSSYREDTLLMTGDVVSQAKSGDNTLVTFKTTSSYSAQCEFVNFKGTFSKNQTVRVIAIANAAEREQSAVKLNNCQLLR